MTNFVVAAIVVVVATIERRAWFGIYLARVQSQIPNVCVLVDFLSLVLGQAAAVQL